MDKCRNWFGVDANNEESLFEYGFLMRYRGNGNYQVIYINGFDKEERPLYSIGWFNPDSWREDFIATLGIDKYPNAAGIAKCSGMDATEWLEYTKNNPAGMVSDMIGYYSNDDVFGSNAYEHYYNVPQIRKRLNRALA